MDPFRPNCLYTPKSVSPKSCHARMANKTFLYIVYFALNAARQNKDTDRYTDTQYTNISVDKSVILW